MSSPQVSIALLTRNGMATLPHVLDAIDQQTAVADVEIVAVDTSSSDGTAELLERRAQQLVRVQRRDFNHGLTRNLAIEHCRGELVVLLVQDAVPASPQWLNHLVAPFAEEPKLAGTMARQLPAVTASRLTRWALERWVLAQDAPFTHALASPHEWSTLAPLERLSLAVFDNVCSCIRRSVWERYHFAPTAIAEDVEWGRDVLRAGFHLRYVPDSAVTHSHQRGPRYELARTYLVHRRLFELCGVRTIPTLAALGRSLVTTFREHLEVLRHGEGPEPDGREWLRALSLSVAWPCGQYLGGRAGARGVHYLRPRGV